MTVTRTERVAASVLAVLVLLLLAAVPASALDVEVKGVRTVGAAVTTAIELRDLIPDRFKKTLVDGGVLHLRVQAELWEARPVWDRLVYPAIVRVFRFTQGAGATLSMTDATGAATTTQEAPRTMPIDVPLGDPSRMSQDSKYYVHVVATLGTLAEREADDVGDAVFGRPSEANSLGALGRLVFRTALQIGDYLQSVTAQTRSRKLSGAEITRP
jgi:hypothetical protein